MNRKYITLYYFYLAVLVLLCAFLGFVTAAPSRATGDSQGATPAPTLPYPVVDDLNSTTRADMMDIAERYWKYKWKAINSDVTIWEYLAPDPSEPDEKE